MRSVLTGRRGTDAEVFDCTPQRFGADGGSGASVLTAASAPCGGVSAPRLVAKRLRRPLQADDGAHPALAALRRDAAYFLEALREVSVHDLAGGRRRITHLTDVFADDSRRICLVMHHAGVDLFHHTGCLTEKLSVQLCSRRRPLKKNGTGRSAPRGAQGTKYIIHVRSGFHKELLKALAARVRGLAL